MTPALTGLSCSHFTVGNCRSCSLLEQAYPHTLNQKQTQVEQRFSTARTVHSIRASERLFGCRIRAKFAISGCVEDPCIGFTGTDQQVIAVADCPLHHPRINAFAAQLPKLIREFSLVPYSVSADRGELKFVVVTFSPTHDQLMVQWVLRSKEALDRLQKLWRLYGEPCGVTVMSVNLQPQRSSLVNGVQEILLSETDCIAMTFSGCTLFYGPQSFVQTNYHVAQQLYRAVSDVVRRHNVAQVLEIYCGVGAFSLTCSSHETQGLGLERSADAVRCAIRSAEFNQRTQLRFAQHDSTQSMLALAGHQTWDAVICNPPRRGLDNAAIELVNALRPPLLIYSSCNPETLQRDLNRLSNYVLSEVTPFDMFPYSTHLELLAILERVVD